jgi:putative addiction module component (TIGR02574 family)
MSPSLQELGIDRLNIEDRLALAQQLWDSVATDLQQEPLTAAQRAELDRRMAAADANPAEGVPWEEVRAEARARRQR